MPDQPPTTQTMRVRWTKETDGNYKLSYEYWFYGAQKDIPRGEVFTGSQTYTEAEALAMFGGSRSVYFGIYGAAERTDKAETIIGGFVDMRKYKVSYQYKNRALNDADGTWDDVNAVNKKVPEADMAPVVGKAMNGNYDIVLPNLAPGFASYKVPTADLTYNPYTPLKDPILKEAGQNWTNIHSFRSVDSENKKATIRSFHIGIEWCLSIYNYFFYISHDILSF